MLIVKTEVGQQVMKDRSIALTPKQRSAFILFDGKRTLDQVLEATAPMGIKREEIDKLFELGLLAQAGGASAGTPNAPAGRPEPAAASAQADPRTPQERYAQAYPIATKLTASLGLRGFRLNLAVEAATSYDELLQVAPKIREAVGADKFRSLEAALGLHLIH